MEIQPAIVIAQTDSKNVNDASKPEVLSRVDSKKRSGSYQSSAASASTNKETSDMLGELTKKAKIESENLRHTAQEFIFRKISSLHSSNLSSERVRFNELSLKDQGTRKRFRNSFPSLELSSLCRPCDM